MDGGGAARRWARARSLVGSGRDAAAARFALRDATSVGRRVRLSGRNLVVRSTGTLIIGDRVQLVTTVAATELVTELDGVLDIGERTLVNFGCSLVAYESVTIGPHCLIGTHCLITDTNFHELDPGRRLERPAPRPVTLGANVWLGTRTIVMPGVSIGDDAAIGAGSVVTRDVPARTLAVGVPARVVRQL